MQPSIAGVDVMGIPELTSYMIRQLPSQKQDSIAKVSLSALYLPPLFLYMNVVGCVEV